MKGTVLILIPLLLSAALWFGQVTTTPNVGPTRQVPGFNKTHANQFADSSHTDIGSQALRLPHYLLSEACRLGSCPWRNTKQPIYHNSATSHSVSLVGPGKALLRWIV